MNRSIPERMSFRAWGKVILLGEHAVVHGSHAIAASLRHAATAQAELSNTCQLHVQDMGGAWNIGPDDDLFRAYQILCDFIEVKAVTKVRLKLPAAAGLGSSASMGVAICRALFHANRQTPSDNELMSVATKWEKVFHGNPSGIDVAVATLGKCIVFSRMDGWQTAEVACKVPLCIGDSAHRSSTREMVQKVANILAHQADGGTGWVKQVGVCVNQARHSLAQGDMQGLAMAMNCNRELLRSVSVQSPELDELCTVALNNGALAAKVTGAGGGGCAIALAPDCQQRVLQAWKSQGYRGFAVNINPQACR